MPTKTSLPSLLVVATLAGCITPYQINIQQGNAITAEMLDQVKIGMTRREVKFVLGTPLVADPFHSHRWDYYHGFEKGRTQVREQHRVTLIFEDDKLMRMEGSLESRPVTATEIKLTAPDPEEDQ